MEKVKILTDKENIKLNDDIIHSFNKKTSNEVKIKQSKTTLELQLLESNPLFYDAISNIIANYIIENIEKEIIKEIVYEECDGLPEGYVEEVLNKVQWEILYKENENARINVLNNEILKIVKRAKVFNLAGFMRFRFKNRFLDLADQIYMVLDDVLEEKGIDDFIAIVKKLIRIQLPKIDSVHIISLGDNKYSIITSDAETIDLEELCESLGKANSDIEYDIEMHELIVSALISILPKDVFFHIKPEHDLKVFSIVKRIYDGRCHKCNDCELCDNIKEKNAKKKNSQE